MHPSLGEQTRAERAYNMVAFHETSFPTGISYGSSGGPGYQTEIIVVDSGAEERIARWANPRRQYNVAYGIKSHEDLSAMQKFYIARRGAENGFRFKDWLDFSTSGDAISTPTELDEKMQRVSDGGVDGDGAETAFQLVKRYVQGPTTRVRSLEKPTAASVVISLDDKAQGQRTGTITASNIPGTVLTDAAATFLAWGIQVGQNVQNNTDGSSCTVVSVDSETQLTTTALSGGSDNRYDSTDAYTILVDWTVNSTIGVITFNRAPGVGIFVKGGCEFEVPVRFGEGADVTLYASIDDFSSGAILDIPIIEVIGSQPVDEEFYYGGGKRYTIDANVTITQLQGRAHVIKATVGGLKVALPDMAGEPAGAPHFYVVNWGSITYDVVNDGGTTVVTLEANKGAVFIYEDTNGDWYAIKGDS